MTPYLSRVHLVGKLGMHYHLRYTYTYTHAHVPSTHAVYLYFTINKFSFRHWRCVFIADRLSSSFAPERVAFSIRGAYESSLRNAPDIHIVRICTRIIPHALLSYRKEFRANAPSGHGSQFRPPPRMRMCVPTALRAYRRWILCRRHPPRPQSTRA